MTTIAFPRAIPRPSSYTGIWSWVTSVDHKRIGTLYGITAFVWFLVGGVEALIMRLQLSGPEKDLVSPEVYNQLFTMHGTTMVFLVVMPLSAAFFNWIIPLQIGARDVAFPRLNAFSYWTFLFGSLLLHASFVFGGAPNAGWFSYANLSSATFNTGNGITFWAMGLQVLGIASLAAAFNFIVTIVNMRAPGMSMFKMPLFTWMTFVTSVLLVLAFPVITVALIQLLSDRLYGTNFFVPAAGGDPVLWQHMFWLFGHPEVYILILPAMGIVSEVLPTFSGKPLFGYSFIVFSGIVIGFMGWFVWSHHMFTVGLGPAANSAFAISTMAIAVPTGVKIFNWIGTIWGGSIRFTTSMLFAIGFIAMFIIGGLSGVTHAAPPADAQQQDTYYIVAHFHYVLFGGSILGIFAGIYYWWPKMTGHLLSERIGKWQFLVTLAGFNITFAPMHWLGLDGMPRRVYTYASEQGWDGSNYVATIGAFLIALGVAMFMWNVIYSRRKGEVATDDPWDGRTLEWSIPSPPPVYNFARIPKVRYRDDFWYRKHPELAHAGISDGEVEVAVEDENDQDEDGHGIHLPAMSYYPVLISAGIALAMAGLFGIWWLLGLGVLITVWGLLGWSFEPPSEESAH